MALLDNLAACRTTHFAGAHLGYISCFHDLSPIFLLKWRNQVDKNQFLMSMTQLFINYYFTLIAVGYIPALLNANVGQFPMSSELCK
jgi:hypothetical protein